jgi:hypothetical protein
MTLPLPPPQPTINTPAWAQQQLQAFTVEDQRAITDLVAQGVVGKSLFNIRVPYAKECMERHWPGWMARLAWTIIELLVRDARNLGPGTGDDDIPF